jgi:SRSO17 transposase
MASKRGGARVGAGRKKVAEKTAKQTNVDLARNRVVDRLPEIADAMIRAALEGDVKAGIYLMDRALGKVTQAVDLKASGGVVVKGYMAFDPDDV